MPLAQARGGAHVKPGRGSDVNSDSDDDKFLLPLRQGKIPLYKDQDKSKKRKTLLVDSESDDSDRNDESENDAQAEGSDDHEGGGCRGNLCEYELQRLARIAQNEKMLQSLGIQPLQSEVPAVAPGPARKARKKKDSEGSKPGIAMARGSSRACKQTRTASIPSLAVNNNGGGGRMGQTASRRSGTDNENGVPGNAGGKGATGRSIPKNNGGGAPMVKHAAPSESKEKGGGARRAEYRQEFTRTPNSIDDLDEFAENCPKLAPRKARMAGHTGNLNQLVTRAVFPFYRSKNLARLTGKGCALMNISWTQLAKQPFPDQPNLLLDKCPVLATLGELTMNYLYIKVWGRSSGGKSVENGGRKLPAHDNPIGRLHWLKDFTDIRKYPCAKNVEGGIAIYSSMQMGDSTRILRASPHTDHRPSKKAISGCCVGFQVHTVSSSKGDGLQESVSEDEGHMKLWQYGHVECFFSFASVDVDANHVTQEMALVRTLIRIKHMGKTLLASCADIKSNPTKRLQIINVKSIASEVVLDRNRDKDSDTMPATIPCDNVWKRKLSSMDDSDGITADSSEGKGDGSSLWDLPVHVTADSSEGKGDGSSLWDLPVHVPPQR